MHFFRHALKKLAGTNHPRHRQRVPCFSKAGRPSLERLEDRLALAATISGTIDFPTSNGTLPLAEALVQVTLPLRDTPLGSTNTIKQRTDAQGHYAITIPNQWFAHTNALNMVRVNHAFCGIPRTAGRHVVCLQYSARPVYQGLAVTLAAAAAVCIGLWRAR